jgi:dihydropteroate synthase
MAVLNTTPDSFFDGGQFLSAAHARDRVDALLAQGADILDIGAESTRPGASPVSPSEQIQRAQPAVERALERGALVSVDTGSSEVADYFLRLGVSLINDATGLFTGELAGVVARHGARLILMHSRGSMAAERFSQYPEDAYGDIVLDVRREWLELRNRAEGAGLSAQDVYFDPGLGFHKNAAQSAALVQRLSEFRGLAPIMVLGASRKSFIGALDNSAPEQRLGGSLAVALLGASAGAQVLRVHDVQETRQALLAWRAFRATPPKATHGGAHA